MYRKIILIVAAIISVGLTTYVFAGGDCCSGTKTAEMKAGQCPGMVQTADNKDVKTNANCPTPCADCPGTMKTADVKSGQCPMHAKNASGECTMKAGEKGDVVKTAEVKDADKLPDGIVEGNVYTLADGTKRFVCPVMQSHQNVSDAKGHTDINGKRYYVCCEGCTDKLTADSKKFLDALVIPANVEKMDGNKEIFKCVVSKEHGTVNKKTLFTDYQGKRYYFCCKDCPGPFEKNPEKFIIKTEKPADKVKS